MKRASPLPSQSRFTNPRAAAKRSACTNLRAGKKCATEVAMTVGEEIRELNHAQPFEPYTIHTTDGKALRVQHPDYCFITPGDFVVYVFQNENTRDVVAVRNIVRIEHKVREATAGDG